MWTKKLTRREKEIVKIGRRIADTEAAIAKEQANPVKASITGAPLEGWEQKSAQVIANMRALIAADEAHIARLKAEMCETA